MQLHHIKDERCTECDSRATDDNQNSQHVNGEWFESRTYKCGKKISYIPNFSKIKEYNPCTKTAAYKEEQTEFGKAKVKILKVAKKELSESKFESFKKELYHWWWRV